MFHFSLDERERNILLTAARRSPTGDGVAALLAGGDTCPQMSRRLAEEAVLALDLFATGGGAFSAPACDLRDRISARIARMPVAA